MKALALFASAFLLVSCRNEIKPPAPIGPTPSSAQLAWHQMEMNAFIHFTTNTFTDLEWGYGDESPAIFNPSGLDAEQWISTLKDAGFKGVILTCKHHDGFCLWPSAYTEHSVKNSPYLDGKGDVVKSVSDACKKFGLKFGVYLSPWDRNHAEYGKPLYIDYYRNQLKEIFTNYGPVFEMWFDGANGGTGYYGGAREKRAIDGSAYYNWPQTLSLVREMNPDIIFFSDAGPGVRWVGNEKGIAGETNWNTITPDTLYAGKAGIESLLQTGYPEGTAWIPAEVDVSIRKGWFYHQKEDSLVKSPEQLFDIYLTSVGRGSTLLLNVPPDRRGLLHENDVASLKGLRKLLDERFKTDLAREHKVEASSVRGRDNRYEGANVVDGDNASYWATDDAITTGSLTVDLGGEKELSYIVIQENIILGQRIKAFAVDVLNNGEWKTVARGTTIGYKRILKIPTTKATKVRLTIDDAKACPVISTLQIF